MAVKLLELRGSGTCDTQGLPFGDRLADQPNRLGFSDIEAAAGKQQIAYHGVAQIPLQARDPAETRDQAQAQLGEGKASRLVGDDQIANQSQFEAAAEGDAVDSGDGG